jgi:aminopyrrolnitrin oxygenase
MPQILSKMVSLLNNEPKSRYSFSLTQLTNPTAHQLAHENLDAAERQREQELTELAASWYLAMPSKLLPKGAKAQEPVRLTLFGEALVAWRDPATGEPKLAQEFCPHEGASLAQSRVTPDGCLECPFHHWQFNSEGKCVKIPFVHQEQIPQTARLTMYRLVERWGYIWVWYGTPEPLFELPHLPVFEDTTNYMSFIRWRFIAPASVLRAALNNFDADHFATVHKLKAHTVEHRLLDWAEQEHDLMAIEKSAWFGAISQASIERYIGLTGRLLDVLGLAFDKLEVRCEGWPTAHFITQRLNEFDIYVLNAYTPVRPGWIVQHNLVGMKRHSGKAGAGSEWKRLIYYVLFALQTRSGARQDLPIWAKLGPRGKVRTRRDRGSEAFLKFYREWSAKAEKH